MVYILIADVFEELEALAPCDMLRRAGVETRLVSFNKHKRYGNACFSGRYAGRKESGRASENGSACKTLRGKEPLSCRDMRRSHGSRKKKRSCRQKSNLLPRF